MIRHAFSAFADAVARSLGHPAAFVVGLSILGLMAFLALWSVFDAIATAATWLMLFILQHSQNRDGAAIQAKLDELIQATNGARNEIAGIDRLTADEVEALREGASMQ